MGKTKVVTYTDPETNHKSKMLIPEETPDEYASEGIPVSINLSGLYPEPFASELQEALWQHGLIMTSDVKHPNALTLIRQSIQQVLKIDANTIREHILRSNNQ